MFVGNLNKLPVIGRLKKCSRKLKIPGPRARDNIYQHIERDLRNIVGNFAKLDVIRILGISGATFIATLNCSNSVC